MKNIHWLSNGDIKWKILWFLNSHDDSWFEQKRQRTNIGENYKYMKNVPLSEEISSRSAIRKINIEGLWSYTCKEFRNKES